MERRVLSFLGVASLLIALALPVCAQSFAAHRVTADIPFEFVSGTNTMPAGEYTIRIMDNPGPVLQVSGPGSRSFSFMASGSSDLMARAEQPRLVFHRYGTQYFLSLVSTGSISYEVLETRVERELAKRASAPPSTLTILAMR